MTNEKKKWTESWIFQKQKDVTTDKLKNKKNK